MEKKNNFIIIVIVALSILVGLLGGYFLSSTLSDKDQSNNNFTNSDENKQPNNNQNNNTNISDDNNGAEKDYSISEAEKLMNKYLYNLCGGKRFISNLSSEEIKNYITLKNSKSSNISCISAYGQEFAVLYNDDYACANDTQFYKYDDVLLTKKNLFGNNSTLQRSYFDYLFLRYDYVEKIKGFTTLEFQGGGDCAGIIENVIASAKIINNELKIMITEKEFDVTEYDKGNKIVSSEEKREYIFRKQNNNYYLAEINKLN